MALRIKQLRKAARLSQQELADKAGVSRSQLSEIETESTPVNTRRLADIAHALGVSIEDLFEQHARDAYLDELMQLWPSMSEDDQRTIIRMAEAFARR